MIQSLAKAYIVAIGLGLLSAYGVAWVLEPVGTLMTTALVVGLIIPAALLGLAIGVVLDGWD